MFNFLKKLLGITPTVPPESWPFPTSKTATPSTPEAPYKVEPAAPAVLSKLDANQDGKVNLSDVNVIVQQVSKKLATTAKKKADVNKDGKVDSKDVKAVATKVANKVKSTVKKPAPKKAAPKK